MVMDGIFIQYTSFVYGMRFYVYADSLIATLKILLPANAHMFLYKLYKNLFLLNLFLLIVDLLKVIRHNSSLQ